MSMENPGKIMEKGTYRYFAFVSYSHKDIAWAKWLQEGLERYKLPSTIRKELPPHIPTSIKPVFRDATDIGLGDLRQTLRTELQDSRYLIIVCSPHSAKSEWVNREIEHFRELGRSDHIIPLIVAGSPESTDPAERCYPPALREPGSNFLGASIDELGKQKALVKIIAGLLGLRFDQLWQRHRRRERKNALILGLTALLVTIAVTFGGAMVWDYYSVKESYFADYVERWGLPEGIGKLDKQQVARRYSSLRFRSSRSKLRSVELVNSAGVLVKPSDTERGDMPACQVFSYSDKDGSLSSVEYQDKLGKTLLKIKYSGAKFLVADFVATDIYETAFTLGARTGTDFGALSMAGNGQANAKSDISRYLYVRDDRGQVIEVRYMRDNRNTPARDADGIFGKAFQLDDKGRVIGITHLNEKGKPQAMSNGMAGKEFQYDNTGNLILSRRIDGFGGSVLDERKIATYRRGFDTFGNEVHAEFLGVDGKPSLNVDGVASYLNEYNNRGFLVKSTYLGIDGQPCINKNGFSFGIAEQDDHGNDVRLCFFDMEMKPCILKQEGAIELLDYDDKNRLVSATMLDPDGRPYMTTEGWSSKKHTYDEVGNLISTGFFGTDGAPILTKDRYARWTATYDGRGNQIGFAYFGVNGKPCWPKDGTPSYTFRYDERGNRVETSHFGLEGQPATNNIGVAGLRETYDAHGKVVRTEYYGLDGSPCLQTEGFAGWSSEYDESGNEIKISYFGIDGYPISSKVGYAGWTNEYDARGNIVRSSNFGTDGKPCLSSESRVASSSCNYDEHGNLVRIAYYGVDSKALEKKDGSAVEIFAYDAAGRIMEQRHLGIDGKPMLIAQGYAGWDATYDPRGNKLSMTYLGLDDHPILKQDTGYAGWRSIYDERDNEVRTEYLGIDGNPAPSADGTAGYFMEYDAIGNVLRITYLDENGEPCLENSIDAATILREYDKSQNVVRIDYLGVDDKPSLCKEGYSIRLVTLQEKPPSAYIQYLDINGKPCFYKDEGFSSARYEFDDRGNTIRYAYFGVDARPCLTRNGYAIVAVEYDDNNVIVKSTSFGVSGEPFIPILKVTEVVPGTPAERVGIRIGDVLLEHAEWRLFTKGKTTEETVQEWGSAATAARDKKKRLSFWRDGKILYFDFTEGGIGFRGGDESVDPALLERIMKDYEKGRR